MDDPSQDLPERAGPPHGPPSYLPRIPYQAPADQEAEANGPTRPKHPRAKQNQGADPSSDGARAPAKVLKQETPALDTAKARQRARLIVGSLLAAVVLVAGLIIFSRAIGSNPQLDQPPEQFVLGPVSDPAAVRRARESQAKLLLDEARQYDAKGQPDLALRRLDRIATAYPETPAGREARAEFDRRARAGSVASKAEKKAPPPRPTASPERDPESVREPAFIGRTGPATAAATEPAATPSTVAVSEPPQPIRPAPTGPVPLASSPANPSTPALPRGFRAREGTELHPSGWPLEIVCERDESVMVLVPAGTFLMGDDSGAPAERPAHKVSLSTFYIDQHEVTNRQYHGLFREADEATPDGKEPPPQNDRPVVDVSQSDALDYAEWAGKTLPTEAQWEKAARGESGRPYPWGRSAPKWERPREPRQIDPVMSFPHDRSPFGALDMAGNAWEWTSDRFEAGYFERFLAAPIADPTGPDRTRTRIAEATIKGGASDWKVAWRSGLRPESRVPYVGFRCALPVAKDAPPPEAPATRPAAPAQPADPAIPVPF